MAEATGWADVFTGWHWPLDVLTEADRGNTVAMLTHSPRPFALFDVGALFQREERYAPFPEAWRPEGLRPPFPATVFRFAWPTDREIDCHIAFADLGEEITAWIIHAERGAKSGYLVGEAWWIEGQDWQLVASDFLRAGYARSEIEDRSEQLISDSMTLAFSALYLLDCRNVTTERALPTRQVRRSYERRGLDIPLEYRIIVKVPGKQSQTIAGARRQGEPVMPAHMVRGHFAEYGADKPLFGKYTGRFWIPAHVRGKRGEGEEILAKDYALIPSEVAA